MVAIVWWEVISISLVCREAIVWYIVDVLLSVDSVCEEANTPFDVTSIRHQSKGINNYVEVDLYIKSVEIKDKML